MFNWLMRKNETISSKATEPTSEQMLPQDSNTSPQGNGDAHSEIEKQIEDALDGEIFTLRHRMAIKQNMMALVQRGLPTETILSVLDAFNTNASQDTSPESVDAKKEIALSKPKQQAAPASEQSADAALHFLPAPFYDFLAWIEDSEQYQLLYANSLNNDSSNTCCFCGGDPDASTSINLLNGWRVHEKCYNLLAGNLKGLNSVLEAKIFFDASPNVMSAFRLINTFWPGTPPDWPARRKTVVARSKGCCEDCGKPDDDIRDALKVHLIKPIEKGGNHALTNMICLCETCRSQYSSDETLGSENQEHGRETYTQRKTDLLNNAMQTGKDVHFTYHDDKGIVSIRTFAPRKWEKRNGTVCIAGFCYLLNDVESFKLHSMTELDFF